MNIIRLKIEYFFKSFTHEDITETIKMAYSSRHQESKDYPNYLKNKWIKLPYKNVKALYESEQVIVSSETSQGWYFIINEDEYNDKNKRVLNVIIIFDHSDINSTINNVLKDMKEKLKGKKVKLKVPKNSSIILYPFDKRTNDIVAYHFVIKYSMNKLLGLNKREKLLNTLVFIITIILCLYDHTIISNGVRESLIASGIFLIITNILSKTNFKTNIILQELPSLYDVNHEITNEDMGKLFSMNGDSSTPSMLNTPSMPNAPSMPSKPSMTNASSK